MAHMPKTPRRSLRSYLRTAPVIVVPFRDTEMLADLECHQPPPLPRETAYKLGKPPAPTLPQRIAAVFDRVFWTVFIGGFLLALASMVALIISGHFGWW